MDVQTGDGATDEARSQPAFALDETTKEMIHPKEATMMKYENALDFEVEQVLQDASIYDVTDREYDEALLQFATENPERIAAIIIENRESATGR